MESLREICERHRMFCEAGVEALGVERDSAFWRALVEFSTDIYDGINRGADFKDKTAWRRAVIIILKSHASALEEADNAYTAGNLKLDAADPSLMDMI